MTKSWVLEGLRDNADKALKVPDGSAVANRALELIGKQLGMFAEKLPAKPITLEDLSTEDLKKLLAGGSVTPGEDAPPADDATETPVQ